MTNVNLPEAEVKTLALRAARSGVLVADGSKLGRTDVAVIGAVGDFQTLVTAGPAPDGVLDELRATGIEVVVSP